jgi:ketosteroid isomerase-like protein
VAQPEYESEQMISTLEHSDRHLEGLPEATGLRFLRSDVEIDVSELPDGRILRGREAVQKYLDSLRADVWRELEMSTEGIAEESDIVVALVRMKGIGRGSGVPVEMPAAWVAKVRDGRVASARFTLDRGGALQALTPADPRSAMSR